MLSIAVAAVLAACSGGGEGVPPTTMVPPTTTTANIPTTAPTTTTTVELERVVRYDLRLDEGETELRTTLTGGPGESIVLLGDGTDRAPTMRLLDETGTELATGTVDETFTDLADLAYRFTSAESVTLEMDSTDGLQFQLRIDATAGVRPTLAEGSRAQLPGAGEYLYRADGDVLEISTTVVLRGRIVVEQLDGDARFSRAAVDLVNFPATRWFAGPGTYRVTVDGRVGAVSINSRSSGLVSATDTADTCAVFESIEQRQLEVGDRLRPISRIIEESLSGGSLDDMWLDRLKTAVASAETAVEALDAEFVEARPRLGSFFAQDLVDVQNGIYASWVRLRDSAAEAISPREFFELIATANDARLLRISETAWYSLTRLDAFTTQVCGFSVRTPDLGIEV